MIIYLCVASFSCCVLKLGGVAHPILPNKHHQHGHATLQTLTHCCAFFLFFLKNNTNKVEQKALENNYNATGVPVLILEKRKTHLHKSIYISIYLY